MYEENSFVPCAKITDDKHYSIISDYVGRPIQAYDNFGNLVWQTDYDIYGNLRNLQGEKDFIPFRQLGQYEDVETGLYYNRFRYYDCNTGLYISKDPIGLLGGFALYGYVKDSNTQVDIFGLECGKKPKLKIDDKIKSQMPSRGWTEANIYELYNTKPTGSSIDKRTPAKTLDGLGRNDSASVYGTKTQYIVVNNNTNEVVQISDKTDPDWIADSRITWFD